MQLYIHVKKKKKRKLILIPSGWAARQRKIKNINDTDGNVGFDVGGEVRTWYVTLPEYMRCLCSNLPNAALFSL